MHHRIAESAVDGLARLAAKRTSPIVLYHATFAQVPVQLDSARLHNVEPNALVAQVDWLRRFFRFVTIDEWFEQRSSAGTACITFDDAYRCVVEEALPRLIEMGVPSTVFVNGSSVAGETFWRDRVAFMINEGLVDGFLASRRGDAPVLSGITADNFYYETKSPERSSRQVDDLIKGHLDDLGRGQEVGQHTMTGDDRFLDHELVTYGCHTYRHYMPSSLSPDDQAVELSENARVLDQLGVRRSNVFSIPFGGTDAVDDETCRLLKRRGFCGMVYSRNAVNDRAAASRCGVATGERYMAPSDLRSFQQRHLSLSTYPRSLPRRAMRGIGRTLRARR